MSKITPEEVAALDGTLVALLACRFAEIVQESLTAHQIATVKDRNRCLIAMGKNSCATHDFCDANDLMSGAFYDTFDREVDVDDDHDCILWGTAWDVAQRVYLS